MVNSLEHTSHSHCLLSCVFRCCCRCCSCKSRYISQHEKLLLYKLDGMNIVISGPMYEYTDMQKTTMPHVGFEVNYEKYRPVACDTMRPGKNSQKFWRNVLPASSGMNIHLACNEQHIACFCLLSIPSTLKVETCIFLSNIHKVLSPHPTYCVLLLM